MNAVDREVRAAAYRWIIDRGTGPTHDELATLTGVAPSEVMDSLRRLEDKHLLAIRDARVVMAHPFSGVDTGYRAEVGGRSWDANCAWDALAILTLMGDGRAVADKEGDTIVWDVVDGKVSPGGVIHLRVPARAFWDDIGFT